jgi:hypothetical protein
MDNVNKNHALLLSLWMLNTGQKVLDRHFYDFLSFKSLLWFVKGNEILLSDW